MSPSGPRRRRRLAWGAGIGGLLLLAALAAVALALRGPGGDVSHPDVEFTPRSPSRASVVDPAFKWPVFGYDMERTRQLPLADDSALHPPYGESWTRKVSGLIEFPPVLGGRSLYVLDNNGMLFSFSRRNGRKRWVLKLGKLAAASPAYASGVVYTVLLERANDVAAGRVAAIAAKTGRVLWSRDLPSRSESSPLVVGGRLYFGTENGTVYALDARTGATRWTYHADGAVKAALAMDGGGSLYFGDYAGNLQSLRARDGSLRWRTSTAGVLGDDQLYSTPAVAYGRVYVGGTNGAVYSFSARDGRLAWRHRTGGYVYGSPAVAQLARRKPTVYVGSYDGRLYALDARTGGVRWAYRADGRISGSAVVVGDLVFFSTLAKTTTALGARSGRFVWRIPAGPFNPLVSDARRLYVLGYRSVSALVPVRPPAPRRHPT